MRILAPIALFVYDRPDHTKEVVLALQKNELASESELFIFSDGAKNEAGKAKIEKVRNYIKQISGFKKITIKEQEVNLGLANSIIAGVTNIVNTFGKIIVLEDDLVTSPFFLRHMNDALDFYENEERVISVHGYMYPIKTSLPETFFIKGADCWGWATWKRGWELFERDGQKLLTELKNKKLNKRFDFDNSYNYTQMLEGQISGRNTSWAVRWYASAFLQNKLTLYPGKTLIQNIGLTDGTHCKVPSGSPDLYNSKLAEQRISIKKIPLEENSEAREAIKKYFRSLRQGVLNRMYTKIKGVGNKKIRPLIKNIIPPVLLTHYQNKKRRYGFFGNYASWDGAKKLTSGYDSDAIIEKVKNAALQVKSGEAVYERDSVVFNSIDHSWPLLASLLWIAGQNDNRLNLVDFGGALGTSYYQNVNFLKHLSRVSWNIVEQKKFVDYGKKLFADGNLHFYDSLDVCLQTEHSKTILLSSVLQYLESPYDLLRHVKHFDYIIVDRMPLFDGPDRIVVQKVPPKIYDASYPCWILNRKKLVDFITNELGFELVADFDAYAGTIIHLGNAQGYFKGFLFKKTAYQI